MCSWPLPVAGWDSDVQDSGQSSGRPDLWPRKESAQHPESSVPWEKLARSVLCMLQTRGSAGLRWQEKLPKRDGAEKLRFGQVRGEGEGALKLLPRIFPSDSLGTRNLTFPILNSHNSPGESLLKKASSPATMDA